MKTDGTQRVVLITGANRGIGFETAKQLAARGFYVVIAARDHPRRLREMDWRLVRIRFAGTR
jgi:NAD(P)-dependent dehydrogenase (short-subunit alcohol dehydrogenase family)